MRKWIVGLGLLAGCRALTAPERHLLQLQLDRRTCMTALPLTTTIDTLHYPTVLVNPGASTDYETTKGTHRVRVETPSLTWPDFTITINGAAVVRLACQ